MTCFQLFCLGCRGKVYKVLHRQVVPITSPKNKPESYLAKARLDTEGRKLGGHLPGFTATRDASHQPERNCGDKCGRPYLKRRLGLR
jgi:hypothetical protein